MNENNLKVKVTSKEQGIKQGGEFNQHKFISDIYECEKQKYILENRKKTISKEISEWIRPNEFKKSYSYKYYCQNYKNKQSYPESKEIFLPSILDSLLGAILSGGITGAIIGVVVNIVVDFIKWKFVYWPLLSITAITILCFFVYYYLTDYLQDKRKYNNYQLEIKRIEEYNKNIVSQNNELYKEALNEFKKSEEMRKNKFSLMEPILYAELDETVNCLSKLNNTLSLLYNLRINGVLCLHPNYRGLVPISVIYGYFDTGRCTQLQGHEGAYNLYEDEKMKGLIINKLDSISQQLGKLNVAMVYVGQAIEECNDRLYDLASTSNEMINSVNNMNNNVTNQLKEVSNQMAGIEENTANSAYYAEVGARMTTFNTVYNLLRE